MTTRAKRRILMDLSNLEVNPIPGARAQPDERNIMHWKAFIMGPPRTVFENGVFQLDITFDDEYPNKPPLVLFTTEMFHPNIYTDGKICLDILQRNWSPQMSIGTILASLQSLLPDPNTDSPANPRAATLYDEDKHSYNRMVREYTMKSLVS